MSFNRLVDYAERIQEKIDAGGQDGKLETQKQRDKFEAELDIEPTEHFAFQEAQARAFASGKLDFDEAQRIYLALGEVQSSSNGGWAPHVTLAMKVTITNIMGELLKARKAS